QISPQPQVAEPRSDELGRVSALVEPLAAAHGVELVEVEWVSSPRGRILRVTIDHPLPDPSTANPAEGPLEGVSLDECVRLSRDVSTALDLEDAVSGAYQLEVSSPGLDRPLRVARDYLRQRGRLAKVKLRQAAPDGQVVLRGTIDSVEGDTVRMTVDGNPQQFRLADVEGARLVFEFEAQPKKAPSKRSDHHPKAAKKRNPKRKGSAS
ncbi:MAG: ribosome maturation factor RimP, partial [Myxococcota bacterium]